MKMYFFHYNFTLNWCATLCWCVTLKKTNKANSSFVVVMWQNVEKVKYIWILSLAVLLLCPYINGSHIKWFAGANKFRSWRLTSYGVRVSPITERSCVCCHHHSRPPWQHLLLLWVFPAEMPLSTGIWSVEGSIRWRRASRSLSC